MPLLKREPDLFPDGLFQLSEAELPWWVAHVRSRQEKALARFLGYFEVPFYLPQRERKIRRLGRVYLSYLPLFTGYVFFRGSRDQRMLAFQSDVLVRVLQVQDQSLLTRELAQLHLLQESGHPLIPHPYLVAGDRIRISEGPFQGYMGVIVREKARHRLVVSVTMLKRSVAVELDADVLQPT